MPRASYEPTTLESKLLLKMLGHLKPEGGGIFGMLLNSVEPLLRIVDNDEAFRTKVHEAFDTIKKEWQ